MSDTEMEVDTPPADTSQDKDASQEGQEGQKGKQGFEVIFDQIFDCCKIF